MSVAALPVTGLPALSGADSRFASAFAVLRDVTNSGDTLNEPTARLSTLR